MIAKANCCISSLLFYLLLFCAVHLFATFLCCSVVLHTSQPVLAGKNKRRKELFKTDCLFNSLLCCFVSFAVNCCVVVLQLSALLRWPQQNKAAMMPVPPPKHLHRRHQWSNLPLQQWRVQLEESSEQRRRRESCSANLLRCILLCSFVHCILLCHSVYAPIVCFVFLCCKSTALTSNATKQSRNDDASPRNRKNHHHRTVKTPLPPPTKQSATPPTSCRIEQQKK